MLEYASFGNIFQHPIKKASAKKDFGKVGLWQASAKKNFGVA